MLACGLSRKERRPESKIIVLMTLGKSAIEDVPRCGSRKHFRRGYNEEG